MCKKTRNWQHFIPLCMCLQRLPLKRINSFFLFSSTSAPPPLHSNLTPATLPTCQTIWLLTPVTRFSLGLSASSSAPVLSADTPRSNSGLSSELLRLRSDSFLLKSGAYYSGRGACVKRSIKFQSDQRDFWGVKTWKNLSTQNIYPELMKKQVILNELYNLYISYTGI